jgi:hypothetical protein
MMVLSPQFSAPLHAVEVHTNAESNFNSEETIIGPHGALLSAQTPQLIDLSAINHLLLYYSKYITLILTLT